MTEIFTAKSVEEAKALAAKKFGKNVSEIKFEVIDEGKKGFLGIGKSDAKIKATCNDAQKPTAAPVKKEEKKAAPVSEKAAPVSEKTTSAPAPKPEKKAEPAAPKTETVKEKNTEAPVKKAEEAKPVKEEAAKNVVSANTAKAEETKSPEKLPHTDDEDYSIDNFTLIEDEALINPKVKIARDYISSIFKAMDVEITFTVYQNETGAIINIESENNGTIIGRRGETLDSVQYLCSIISNKGDKDYFRITIDCLGYRQKRKETLEQLAVKVAKNVLRTGRSQPLEPMNPYERRVIHSAVADIEGVSSRSVGEEPYRKIVISSNNPHRGGGKRRDNRRDGGRGDGRRNRPRNHEPENFERKSVDVSTSFEKDYKRPKPEDSIEGGLYGKIEL